MSADGYEPKEDTTESSAIWPEGVLCIYERVVCGETLAHGSRMCDDVEVQRRNVEMSSCPKTAQSRTFSLTFTSKSAAMEAHA
jgi:hypothetical protein